MERYTGLVGLAVLVGIALVFSIDRRRVPWRVVIGGVSLQFILALLLLRANVVRAAFDGLARAATTVLGFSDAGASYIFGPLFDSQALGEAVYEDASMGSVFAFKVLPTIIFFASLLSVLYHLGIMQWVVRAMAVVMRKTLRVSGAESLAMAANVFVGQTEAPLVVRPFVSRMTQSELMALMTGGFATIAGGVFAAYIAMLGGDDPEARVIFAKHLLCASIMSAPAAFVMAKIMVPEREDSLTTSGARLAVEKETRNVIDAAARGAGDGLKLALNVGAMLLAFLALLAMCDYPLIKLGQWEPVADWLAQRDVEELNIATILGWIFAPLARVMGVAAADASAFGSLLGQKIVLTEFIAFDSLGKMQGEMEQRSVVIATYALCGFANFGSIAIQLGGIGSIAPDRRGDLARFGLRAMFGGAMASWMTACVVGILL
ncbi:MAG: NupC/NupG family nucleoside CNT transporter [bacterium]|nr:NupC/NupG family nucleoside CNT transporter [bacterium]